MLVLAAVSHGQDIDNLDGSPKAEYVAWASGLRQFVPLKTRLLASQIFNSEDMAARHPWQDLELSYVKSSAPSGPSRNH